MGNTKGLLLVNGHAAAGKSTVINKLYTHKDPDTRLLLMESKKFITKPRMRKDDFRFKGQQIIVVPIDTFVQGVIDNKIIPYGSDEEMIGLDTHIFPYSKTCLVTAISNYKLLDPIKRVYNTSPIGMGKLFTVLLYTTDNIATRLRLRGDSNSQIKKKLDHLNEEIREYQKRIDEYGIILSTNIPTYIPDGCTDPRKKRRWSEEITYHRLKNALAHGIYTPKDNTNYINSRISVMVGEETTIDRLVAKNIRCKKAIPVKFSETDIEDFVQQTNIRDLDISIDEMRAILPTHIIDVGKYNGVGALLFNQGKDYFQFERSSEIVADFLAYINFSPYIAEEIERDELIPSSLRYAYRRIAVMSSISLGFRDIPPEQRKPCQPIDKLVLSVMYTSTEEKRNVFLKE
jgi:hypothetical protein